MTQSSAAADQKNSTFLGSFCTFAGMVHENLYQPFEIEYRECTECPIDPHKHNFFELVYIVEGDGVQSVNQHQLPYSPEKLFLVMPQDSHSFEVKETTKFFFIRFNNIYLKNQPKDWIQQLEFIFQNNNHLPGCILKNKTDKPLVKSLIEALIRELVNQQHYHKELAQQIVNTIIMVVARNMLFQLPEPARNSPKTDTSQNILHYIHEHIYSPEKLRAEQIATHFNISPTYLSEYFKRHNGDSLQQYITQYKLKLVEIRLQYSQMRVGEIAWELGFTDESHLNRIFKKYKGVNPSAFRKEVQVQQHQAN
ncbi:AraC family transcriptional regulator [Chitinophaga nivalis]|uniref:AraC family transcriptional regulator n=1 Tax=Chitinophaga nivalis TaxID=2991709 RepID=A0ABT3IWF8_9BACT|nr:AraC family transcriptional regulator [Chitinophaga nivalis]MCW3462020.1 AraC family transcriptional regulator [Chitinophaga nivalis]MCW3488288.1 AraC family transcriptional regulator [Chitinophaga nivalis]